MVVEELQILVGCDASTAEKVLTELETRLNRFVKQSASSMQNAKAIRAQATAEKEALKTEAARVKYANGIAKLNLALEAAQRKAAQAAEKLNEKMRKIFASASKQSNAFEQMADGQCESLNKVAETAEEVERRLDEAMNRTPNGWGKKENARMDSDAEAFEQSYNRTAPDRDLAEKFVKEANTAELFNMKLDQLYEKLQRLLGVEEKLSEGGGTGQGLERVRGQILSVTEQIQKMQEKAKTAFETLPKTAKKAAAKTQGVFAKLGKAIGKILSRMIIWRAINAVIMSVQEGLNNMAQASKKANATLSQLQSGFTYVKNSIASAFMPVLQSLVPIITRVANAIAGLFNTIGAFFAKLRGQDTFTKAVYAEGNLTTDNRFFMTSPPSASGSANTRLVSYSGGGGYSLGMVSSSIRYKKEIHDIREYDSVSDRIDRVRAVTYTPKSGLDKGRYFYGFIAEELETEFPWLVDYQTDKGTREVIAESVEYDRVPAILWADAQATHSLLRQLDERIKRLEQ